MEIHGYCHERFGAVREAFERNFAERGEVGATFAATVGGECVADLWAGHRDAERTLPWERDTLVCVYSTTKTMTSLAALILCDRGELRFDDPVTKYWPEYGQNGKASTELRHVMGHTAGLPGFGETLTYDELYDWDHVVGVLERQAPAWPPGEGCAYHGLTQGFLIGEIVRRITSMSLGTFFREQIAGPLGADFHIGLTPEPLRRTADVLLAGPMPEGLSKYLRERQSASPRIMPPASNTEAFRRAELPAVNGHGNARSVARVQTVVANGGSAFGIDLLGPAAIEQIFREQGVMEGIGVRHGIGYGLSGLVARHAPRGTRTSFWWGAGGSSVILDHTRRACLCYVMNRMDMNIAGDRRGSSLTRAFYQALR